MDERTINTIREALTEVKGLARTLDQVKHYRGATYYQDKIARIDAALAALEQAAPISAMDSFMPLEALKMAYRKHHLGDDSIGWNELSDHMLNALCEAMGDKGFQRWLEAQRPATAAGEEEQHCE